SCRKVSMVTRCDACQIPQKWRLDVQLLIPLGGRVVRFGAGRYRDMGMRCSLTNFSRILGALVLLAGACLSYAADACNPADIHGPYGFQLSGTTTIGGKEAPIAVVGRLTFTSDEGAVSGVTSVNFNGYFLGNPTTGKYEAKDDCTVT